MQHAASANGIPYIQGSDNIFRDLDLPEPEALDDKAVLVASLRDVMRREKLTQAETARRCGTDQGTVSKVLRGRLDLVTIERLISWLRALDQDVEIVVRERERMDGIETTPSASI